MYIIQTMSNLTPIEKRKLEKILEMQSGYVLDFSNKTLQNFFLDVLGVDIYDKKYDFESGSKANRIRAFWKQESNQQVGKLLESLLGYWKDVRTLSFSEISTEENALYEDCLQIAERLKSDSAIDDVDALAPNSDDKDFEKLANSIKESIKRNEPDQALDRLHTFLIKYIRSLCDRHEIEHDKKMPLHGLFGMYIKHVKAKGLLESKMSHRIMRSSISILDDFNDVRNNMSFAHDNSVLNYHESILIFNNIINTIRFIESIEMKNKGEAMTFDYPMFNMGELEQYYGYSTEELQLLGFL